MKRLFISHPYRDEKIYKINQNIQNARKFAMKYWLQGYNVYCPHLNTAFMDDLLPDKIWLEAHLDWLKLCDVIVMCGSWRYSIGCTEEHDLAMSLKQRIIYDDILMEV